MLFCSTIIPTIGRPELDRAVISVLTQDLPPSEFELIVVNDSGRPLPPAPWQADPTVTVLHTDRRERSVARNTGAAVARGRYLHFLDDDDWLLPGAFQRVMELAGQTKAAWLYGITQLVDRAGHPLILLDHRLAGNCFTPLMAGEWIPLQASWIEAGVFQAAGGFNPTLSGPEDVDLARRIALRYEFAPLKHVTTCVAMGEAGSTTPWQRHSEQSRAAREHILDDTETYPRLLTSAPTAYWRGRISRIYATSAVWNFRRRKVLRATARLGMALRATLGAGRTILGFDYWRAFLKPYASLTFAASEGLTTNR